MKEINIGKIINNLITILLIIVIGIAIQQRAFEKEKCTSWCQERIVDDVKVLCRYSDSTEKIVEYKPNWTNLLKPINGEEDV